MSRKIVVANADDLCKRYLAGESELALAKSFNVQRSIVRRHLIEAGITPRGRKDASVNRYARTTSEERASLTDAAHAAIRGHPKSFEYLCKRAIGREKAAIQSDLEILLGNYLTDFSVSFTPQKAIGPYNVDLAITEYSVAVEVFGGNWHATGKHSRGFRKRCDYLLNTGWLPVIIWSNPWLGEIDQRAAEYVISLLERISCGESRPTKELVIGGTGKTIPTDSYDPNNGSVITRFVGTKDRPRDNDGRFTK